jgi:ribosome assembly protein YihI (activator of Der GTPase)
MPKRITTQDLHNRLHIIETNHLAHIEQDLDNLDTAVKENRKYFESRLDRLDNRIWGLVLLALSTLGATIASIVM